MHRYASSIRLWPLRSSYRFYQCHCLLTRQLRTRHQGYMCAERERVAVSGYRRGNTQLVSVEECVLTISRKEGGEHHLLCSGWTRSILDQQVFNQRSRQSIERPEGLKASLSTPSRIPHVHRIGISSTYFHFLSI
jgi:hypothetical protein